MASTWQYASRNLSENATSNSGVEMPRILFTIPYHGQTKEFTEDLVVNAVKSGFRGLHIVGRPANYYHPGVDAGLKALFASGIERSNLFIQITVNPKLSADYFPDAPLSQQLELLVKTALDNIGVEYFDSLVLHTSFHDFAETMESWRALEEVMRIGWVDQLGVWNLLPLRELHRLYAEAEYKPAVLQEVYLGAQSQWPIRAWCVEEDIYVQSSWMLVANRRVLNSVTMRKLANKHGIQPAMLFFRVLAGMRIMPLISSNDTHAGEYAAALRVPLMAEEIEEIIELLKSRDEDKPPPEKSLEERESRDDFATHIDGMQESASQARWDEALSLLWSRHSKCRNGCREAVPSDAPKTVVLLGSHIRNEARLARVQQFLMSVIEQASHMPMAFLASVSSSTPELMDSVRHLLSEFEQAASVRGMAVHVAYRSKPLSQFTHYASLVGSLLKLAEGLGPQEWNVIEDSYRPNFLSWDYRAGSKNIWLIFSDDDDLWHPYRTVIYSEAINTTLKSVGVAPLTLNFAAQNLFSSGGYATTPKDVDQLMQNGSGTIHDYGEESQYWQQAVPLQVFLDFVLCTPPAALEHESCDRRFAEFMRCHSHLPVVCIKPYLVRKFWMYFHRQHDEGRVSTSMWSAAKTELRDEETAKAIEGSLRQSYAQHWEMAGQPGLDSEGKQAYIEKEGSVKLETQWWAETREKDENPVVRVVAELRRFVERWLCGFGAWLPVDGVISNTLFFFKLNGTLDEDLWTDIITSLVVEHGTTLGLPRRPSIEMGERGGYKHLQLNSRFWEDLELHGIQQDFGSQRLLTTD